MTGKEKIIMDKEEISLAIKRIAKEIVDANHGTKDIVLIGVMNRGVPIAQRIAKIIDVPVGSLDVSLHRDDIHNKGSQIQIQRSDIPFSIDGKVVVLVDDVIYAGRTIRAAMDGLNDYGRPSRIHLAALVDRGNRELPIHPDFVGKRISTTKDEDVMVNIAEIDGVDKAILR